MQSESTITYMVSFKAGPGFITIKAKNNKLTEISLKNTTEQRENAFVKRVKTDIQNYLRGEKVSFDYPLDFSGLTPFPTKVFKLLREVPYGETISYKKLANKANTGARAAGRILGSNPFPIIIPCHRVINASGALGGFSGGLNWKKYLLKIEGVNLT
jgi:methylated-DNA-[protein]-cysteine S-methyltransferase